jgi:hypothetical protein
MAVHVDGSRVRVMSRPEIVCSLTQLSFES